MENSNITINIGILRIFDRNLPTTQGVPQGSILGPLLYIIYANDISNIFKNCKSIFYADDTVLFNQGTNIQYMEDAIQEYLDRLQFWCNENQIFVNANKTKYMLFGSKTKLKSNPELKISIGQKELERANSYTYLGVTLDEQLNYERHSNQLIKRVSDKLYQ